MGIDPDVPQRLPAHEDLLLNCFIRSPQPSFVPRPIAPKPNEVMGFRPSSAQDVDGAAPKPGMDAVRRVMAGDRKYELRDCTSFTLDALLRDICLSEDMSIHSSQVLMERTGNLELTEDRGKSVVVGRPTYGIYFGEISPNFTF